MFLPRIVDLRCERRFYSHDREAFDLISELEHKIGFTKAGQTLIQIPSASVD